MCILPLAYPVFTSDISLKWKYYGSIQFHNEWSNNWDNHMCGIHVCGVLHDINKLVSTIALAYIVRTLPTTRRQGHGVKPYRTRLRQCFPSNPMSPAHAHVLKTSLNGVLGFWTWICLCHSHNAVIPSVPRAFAFYCFSKLGSPRRGLHHYSTNTFNPQLQHTVPYLLWWTQH